MPASRTPEGDSAKCEVCGAVSYVLLSDPPRDSVCPSCGSYLQQFGSAYGHQSLRVKIYKFLIELQQIARSVRSKTGLREFLPKSEWNTTDPWCPMTHSGRLIGAVQVVQRNVESPAIQMGYRMFIQQVSGLASYGVAQLCQ